ncbi:MAG: NERD domain-containing protein [Bacteroidetes bacterium]|nr:MAG: NERD domain-containing protein [Bacteroidota bacterium]
MVQEKIVIVLILSISLILWFKKNRIKGYLGEKKTALYLSLLPKSKYTVLNNLVLKNKYGTTQIDHLVISDYGIFVIETKNYKGRIYGSEHGQYWKQVLFKYKNELYNPILQNKAHINAVKNLLRDMPHLYYISIIVFSSKASLYLNCSTIVTFQHLLRQQIKRHRYVTINPEEKREILERIKTNNISSTFNKREHVKSIRKKDQNSRLAIEQNRCPRCKNRLVLKNGKHGQFLGCASFPNCSFSKNV